MRGVISREVIEQGHCIAHANQIEGYVVRDAVPALTDTRITQLAGRLDPAATISVAEARALAVEVQSHRRRLSKAPLTHAQAQCPHNRLVAGVCEECGYVYGEATQPGYTSPEQASPDASPSCPAWAVVAWVWDRREQYDPSSGTYEGLSQIIKGLARGSHVEAWKHGELDDLKKDAERVMRGR